ncbi:MAG: hypothetical protein ABSE49_16840 [Polyangiaceae bacterium]|jgi:hypothetical protein
MRLAAFGFLTANLCVLGAAASLAGCSGCGGVVAEDDGGAADAVAASGDADGAGVFDAEAGDAPTPADAGTDATTREAGPDGSLDCLYPDAASVLDAGVASGPCPATAPVVGSPCETPFSYCEYGSSWWSSCNLLVSCVHGIWQSADLGPEHCPELDAGPSGGACVANPCPATWAEALAMVDAGACPASSCQYPEGACLCGIGTIAGCFSASTWSCVPEQQGCVFPRPRFGTPCDPDASVYCEMGWSCSCWQSEVCGADNVWVGSPTGEPCMM